MSQASSSWKGQTPRSCRRLKPPSSSRRLQPGESGVCRIAAIESRHEEAFLAAAKEKGLVPVVRKRVDGLNINGGDDVDIALYQSAADATDTQGGNEQQ
jgi:hypothetical protein